MKKVHFCCIAICLIMIQMLFSSCYQTSPDANKADYITATGIIHYIKYNEDNSALYLGLSDIEPSLDDNMFKIEGENLQIAQENHMDDYLVIGEKIEFITNPEYLGDGYVYSIVGLSIDGITILPNPQ